MADNKTIKTRIMLKHDTAANWAVTTVADKGANLVLKAGELAYDSTNKYIKFGDGTTPYKDLDAIHISAINVDGLSTEIANAISASISSTQNIVDIVENYTDAQISAYKDGEVKNVGDVVINKKKIGDTDVIERTAYGWTGTVWAAFSGNYSADNVYFANDITAAGAYDKVGNVTVDTTIAAKGKSLTEVMGKIFTKELSGGVTVQPSASGATLKAKENGVGSLVPASKSFEYGTYLTDIAYSGASFNAGKYTYNDPSITPTSWATTATNSVAVTDDGSGKAGTLESIVIGDQGKDTDNTLLSGYTTVSSVKITSTATYPADTVSAMTNLGHLNSEAEDENYEDVVIAGGTKSSDSGTFSGFRAYFWGYRTVAEGALDINNLSSGNIRDDIHAAANKTAFPSTTSTAKATNFTVPANTKQIIFAAPAGKVTKKIAVYNNSSLGSTLDFDNGNARKQNAVNVEGANGYTAIAYDIWYVTFPACLEVETNLAITWA